MSNKIKKNDTVIVRTGKDKNRSGKVIKVDGERVLVEGINMVKKTIKPNPNRQIQGGIVDREASIHRSNVALLNPQTNKADRVKFKVISPKNPGEKSKKVRCYKSNDELVDL
ncbi:MAG: 50S ribosomal protein L24 [Gammaproteobacteria bacterium RIFCSPHIGHO2_12_FULL_42_13]|nr:MAG: 50S ribosomal protein L24 [Gammaproteobacteria bacterium RIFCSPHIGHO2_12_FULL_42_13]